MRWIYSATVVLAAVVANLHVCTFRCVNECGCVVREALALLWVTCTPVGIGGNQSHIMELNS